jgi:hypothetical protein
MKMKQNDLLYGLLSIQVLLKNLSYFNLDCIYFLLVIRRDVLKYPCFIDRLSNYKYRLEVSLTFLAKCGRRFTSCITNSILKESEWQLSFLIIIFKHQFPLIITYSTFNTSNIED